MNWNLLGAWITLIGTITAVMLTRDISWMWLLVFLNAGGFIVFIVDGIKHSIKIDKENKK